ncbi:MAG: hypothetical protein ACXADA_17960 [Candidatus Hodarchaeales archaeon]
MTNRRIVNWFFKSAFITEKREKSPYEAWRELGDESRERVQE